MIGIHLNGESRQVPEGLSLAALLEWLKVPTDRVAVEHNLVVVPKARWGETLVQSGDKLEVVHFVGGGCSSGKPAVRARVSRAFRRDRAPSRRLKARALEPDKV